MNLTDSQAATIAGLFAERGVSQADAATVMRLVAGFVAKSAQVAKAERQGMTLAELQSYDLGRSIAQRTAGTVRKTGSAGLSADESEQFQAGRAAMRKFQNGGA